MKQTIFTEVQLKANYRHTDGVSHADRYSSMNVRELRNAIAAVRTNHPSQYATRAEHQFLSSINATCRNLPHTNEASLEARKIYFSYLMHFGLPAVFLTITPDDQRNYRIVLYALTSEERARLPDVNAENLSNDQILLEFKMRQSCRTATPGLCAEEYHRIMTLVIKHLFQWDEAAECSTGQGCFGELLAWCLATEEQGRKSLHGHFLLFLKNWQGLMSRVQRKWGSITKMRNAQNELISFCASISSARLFAQFEPPFGELCEHPIYKHECVQSRSKKRMKYTCKGVDEQLLRNMRHKKKCRQHNGHIATCLKCNAEITVNDIVTSALRHHLGSDEYEFGASSKKLEHYVYASQQDVNWYKRSAKEVATRYFVNNVMVNIHSPFHATRCFKKGCECYANLPELPSEHNTLHFKDESDEWFDYKGNQKRRYMFRFSPKRNIEDVFMNVHSPVLTKAFASNTNVLAGMNGPVVFYVTGYQAKQQQKEERSAFTKVSETLCKIINRQAEEETSDVPPHQQGFRRLLAGIYAHTNAHIMAAPMAHFLSLHGSRFRFLHHSNFLPVIGIESYLLGENTTGIVRTIAGKSAWYHKAMDYVFRPHELETMSLLNFFQQVKSMRNAETKKQGIEETFEFDEAHPFKNAYSIVYREKECVAIFPWNWIGSTSEFQDSLIKNIHHSHKEYAKREEYCRRFLMLFIPFRSLNDLLDNRSSYQEAFQAKVWSNGIDEDVKNFANNIQDIHNSLRVDMPVNMLTDRTDLDEEEEIENQSHEHNTSEQEAQILATIVETFAATANQTIPMLTTAMDITPRFIGLMEKVPTEAMVNNDEAFTRNTIVFECAAAQTRPNDRTEIHVPHRFVLSIAELNTLVYRTLIDSNLVGMETKNQVSNATGSKKSIVQWGRNDGLDVNQQIAFEILVATYVLTFHEDATGNGMVRNNSLLKKLARQRSCKNERLRMFITGPAGAGKCE